MNLFKRKPIPFSVVPWVFVSALCLSITGGATGIL